MSLTASTTFSGVIQLDAPPSSLAPHRDGHHCGPTGVIIWAHALTPPVPVKTIATTSALRSVREFIMVMPPMFCSPRPFVEPPRPTSIEYNRPRFRHLISYLLSRFKTESDASYPTFWRGPRLQRGEMASVSTFPVNCSSAQDGKKREGTSKAPPWDW